MTGSEEKYGFALTSELFNEYVLYFGEVIQMHMQVNILHKVAKHGLAFWTI